MSTFWDDLFASQSVEGIEQVEEFDEGYTRPKLEYANGVTVTIGNGSCLVCHKHFEENIYPESLGNGLCVKCWDKVISRTDGLNADPTLELAKQVGLA